MKTKRKYTVSAKVLIQRANANRKETACRDWVTTKVGRALAEWAKEKYGSVHRALETLKTNN